MKKKSKVSIKKGKTKIQDSRVVEWARRNAKALGLMLATGTVTVAVLLAAAAGGSAKHQTQTKIEPEQQKALATLATDLQDVRGNNTDKEIEEIINSVVQQPTQSKDHVQDPIKDDEVAFEDFGNDIVLEGENGVPECVTGDGTATSGEALQFIETELSYLDKNTAWTNDRVLEILKNANSRFCFQQNLDPDATWKENEQAVKRMVDDFMRTQTKDDKQN